MRGIRWVLSIKLLVGGAIACAQTAISRHAVMASDELLECKSLEQLRTLLVPGLLHVEHGISQTARICSNGFACAAMPLPGQHIPFLHSLPT